MAWYAPTLHRAGAVVLPFPPFRKAVSRRAAQSERLGREREPGPPWTDVQCRSARRGRHAWAPRHRPFLPARISSQRWRPLPVASAPVPPPATPALPPSLDGLPVPGEVRSADVAQLTSPDLAGLKRLINEAAQQRAALAPDFSEALKSRLKAWRKLRRREQLPLRPLLRRTIPGTRAAFEAAETEAATVAGAIAASEVRVEVPLSPEASTAYAALERAHAALAQAMRIWDLTASVGIDRVRTRSAASNAITRVPVRLSRVTEGIAANGQYGLRFGNANGGDLDLYPGFLLMRSQRSGDYALVDLRDLRVRLSRSNLSCSAGRRTASASCTSGPTRARSSSARGVGTRPRPALTSSGSPVASRTRASARLIAEGLSRNLWAARATLPSVSSTSRVTSRLRSVLDMYPAQYSLDHIWRQTHGCTADHAPSAM
jgi:hypothetical protein